MNLHSAIPVLTVMNFHHVLLGQIGTWSMNKVFLFRKPNNGKNRGLAVLVGVVRCHEMGVCASLVKRLPLEATFGIFL